MNPVEEFLEMKKQAGWLGNLWQGMKAGLTSGKLPEGASTLGQMMGQVGQGVAVSAAVTGAGLGLAKGVGAIRERFGKARNFQAMITANPSLQKEDAGHVQMLYNSLHRLSPTMAKDPVLAGSFVRESLRMGPEGQPSVRFDTAKMLSETERNVAQSGKGHPILEAIGRNMKPMMLPPQGVPPQMGMFTKHVPVGERGGYAETRMPITPEQAKAEMVHGLSPADYSPEEIAMADQMWGAGMGRR